MTKLTRNYPADFRDVQLAEDKSKQILQNVNVQYADCHDDDYSAAPGSTLEKHRERNNIQVKPVGE